MRRFLSLIVVVLAYSHLAFGQEQEQNVVGEHREDSDETQIETNTSEDGVDDDGLISVTRKTYKVQIYIGKDMGKAVKIKEECESYFISFPVFLSYTSPNYRVKVGAFDTLKEAQDLKEMVKDCFKYVFVVPEYEELKVAPRDSVPPISVPDEKDLENVDKIKYLKKKLPNPHE